MRSAAAGSFRLDISDPILNEILRVLQNKFTWDTRMRRKIEEDMRLYTHVVHPTENLNVITADSADNRILECALAAKSDCIVSGDARHVLPLRNFRGIRIVKVADVLEQVEARHERK